MDNITINYCIYECYGAKSYLPLAWTGVEFFYLITLQAVALVLAIANRNVKIEALNDFKEMSIIVYTITIMLIPLLAITYGVSMYTTISEVFFSGAIMLATTVFLFFTFVPKVSWWKVKSSLKRNCFNSVLLFMTSFNLSALRP